jgi:formate C-acetyltransferase
MRDSIAHQKPCWQAARVSHFNHYLMGLATSVDSLAAIHRLVFREGRLSLREFAEILAANWVGHEALRQEIRTRFPRYGQPDAATQELAAELGRMWVEEVESASRGMERVAMWPGFYSHMVHLHEGARTGATADGRVAGQPLSENLGPSPGTPPCAPTSVLDTMAALPFDHTPSGAATLTLSPGDFAGEAGLAKLVALIESYFALGGLQIQINLLDASVLSEAMRDPAGHGDLMVRVAGFSALFVRLSRDVQEDVLRRCSDQATGRA